MKTPHTKHNRLTRTIVPFTFLMAMAIHIPTLHAEEYKMPEVKVVEKTPVTDSVSENLANDFKVEGVNSLAEGRSIASSDGMPEVSPDSNIDREPSSQKVNKIKDQKIKDEPKQEESFFKKYTNEDVKNPNLWKHKLEYKNY